MTDYHKLSVDERLILIKEIEDSIASDIQASQKEPLPEWQKVELDRALEEHALHPEEGVSWNEVIKRLRAAL
jgi:putative addiction module component (TIGR02574 family)